MVYSAFRSHEVFETRDRFLKPPVARFISLIASSNKTNKPLKSNHNKSMPEQFEAVLSREVERVSAKFDDAPRIYGPFSAFIRGTNVYGEQFGSQTALDDLSAMDFSLRLRQPVEMGAKLFAVARLHKALVAIRGRVLKAEPQEDGRWWLSVAIIHNRFLS